MEVLIFDKENVLNDENINFISNIYNKFNKNNKLILFLNNEYMFIDNDYNKIKHLLKDILTLLIDDYNNYLHNINFFNVNNYKTTLNILKIFFIEICKSNENIINNNILMMNDEIYSVLNCIFCLEDLYISFFNKIYYYKKGGLIIFPCGWTFLYKIQNEKLHIIVKLYI